MQGAGYKRPKDAACGDMGGWEGVLSQNCNRTFAGGGDKPQKDKVSHREVCNRERKDGFQGQLNRPRVGLVLVQVGGWGQSHSDI